MTSSQVPQIHGYHAPILRGVWERITTFGVIRGWAHGWAAISLFLGLLTLTYVGFRWTVVPLVLWLVVHGVLVLLTQWNVKWDEMVVAQWRRRYKARYDAG